MPTKLYGGLHERNFRAKAIAAVVEHWNSSLSLTAKYGAIDADDVFVVWQVKVIQNGKALLGVSREGDGMYYEYTWNGDAQEGYLDVYTKTMKITTE